MLVLETMTKYTYLDYSISIESTLSVNTDDKQSNAKHEHLVKHTNNLYMFGLQKKYF